MMNSMYTVKLNTSESELGELISLVGTMRHTTVVCANKDTDNRNGTVVKVIVPRKKPEEVDPRLVYRHNTQGLARIDIDKSLAKLGLSRDWLLSNKTKGGTPEHAVKMAMTSGRKAVIKAT